MGMFDTIRLDPPLKCPDCGAEQREFQTHELGDIMASYRIGSVVSMASVRTGILRERFWCAACHKAGRKDDASVYLAIFHSVLVAVETDEAEAGRKLAAVDRLDLIGWIEAAQREALAWRRRYFGLRNDLHLWREDQLLGKADDSPEPGDKATLRNFFGVAEEIRDSDDPLGVILERNPPDGEDGGFYG